MYEPSKSSSCGPKGTPQVERYGRVSKASRLSATPGKPEHVRASATGGDGGRGGGCGEDERSQGKKRSERAAPALAADAELRSGTRLTHLTELRHRSILWLEQGGWASRSLSVLSSRARPRCTPPKNRLKQVDCPSAKVSRSRPSAVKNLGISNCAGLDVQVGVGRWRWGRE